MDKTQEGKGKEYSGGLTTPNFHIEVTLGIIVYNTQIIRNERALSCILGTEQGVKRFLTENQPYVNVKITDLNTNDDLTSEFTEGIEFCKTRYQGGESFVDMRK